MGGWELAKSSKELKPPEHKLKTECPRKMWIKTADQAMVHIIEQKEDGSDFSLLVF